MGIVSNISALLFASVRDLAFTYRPTLRRDRRAVRDYERRARELADDGLWGSLKRPLVLIQGYNDVPERMNFIAKCIERKTGGSTMPVLGGFDVMRDLGVEQLAAEFVDRLAQAGHDEVDIIAHSMGGLVALAMARRPNAPRVVRLHALASPLRGTPTAILGKIVGAPFREQLRDLSPESELLLQLSTDERLDGIEIHTHRVRGDLTVFRKSAHAAGDAHTEHDAAYWQLPDMTHMQTPQEPRVVAAVLRSLLADP